MNMKNSKLIFLQGGLGNQLFQLSFGVYLASKKQCLVMYDKSLLTKLPSKIQSRNYELYNFVDDSKVHDSIYNFYKFFYYRNILASKKIYFEKSLNDNHLNFILPNTALIAGYFQQYEYAEQAWSYLEPKFLNLVFNQKIEDEEYISVHIRLGDYRTNKHAQEIHGTLTKEYYLKGIEVLLDIKKPKYIKVISDEIELAKEILNTNKFRIPLIYDNNSNHFDNLAKLARSSGVVMSNSSFSWWGAFVAEKQQSAAVVSPKKWFKSDLIEEPRYLIKPEWIKI